MKMKKYTAKLHEILSLALVSLLVSCAADPAVFTEKESQEPTYVAPEEKSEVIAWIEEEMNKYYLYNDEYAAIEKDYSLSHVDFLEETLFDMQRSRINVLDGWYFSNYPNDSYLYSYVLPENSRSRAATEGLVSNGILSAGLIQENPAVYVALAVYPSSPASENGIQRGVYYTIAGASSFNISESIAKVNGKIVLNNPRQVNIIEREIQANPILKCEWLDDAQKIGYLCYSSYEYDYFTELLTALDKLQSAEHLILDLRFNGGGYVFVANYLCKSILGNNINSNSRFAEYRLNNDFTAAGKTVNGFAFDATKDVFYENFLADNSFNIPKFTNLKDKTIYVLTSENTASASELTISSLSDNGFNVVQIGFYTEGKNSGMFVLENTIGGTKYELCPISFEILSDVMHNRIIEPDHFINEYSGLVEYSIDGLISYGKFADIGNPNEPLLKAALTLIDGGTIVANTAAVSAALTRSSDSKDRMKVVNLNPKVSKGAIVEVGNE